MGSHVKVGWEESERAEFGKALKASLLVQTPLQAQATLFTELQKKVDRIAARDVSGEELLGRLRLCEDALSAINHEKLSPFNQQQILQRLDTVEAQAAATQASVTAFLGSSEGQPAAEASTEVPDRPGSGRLGAGGGCGQAESGAAWGRAGKAPLCNEQASNAQGGTAPY
ncbi:uncharacterized protein HaLaN_16618 [Haematococcus lacustris]|uniref:Uncharacterized protein n=1 Tax=Haematococcus lacustris TaxID=44745 RepID=A0A699ZLG0_HAELA|nr:uncharacterized protein HaLaN_16618 [Haematococcus lacustris]